MKTLVIKLSGELFSYNREADQIKSIIQQVKTLSQNHRIALIVGGGNFFRGASNKNKLGIEEKSAHSIGMLATMVNGIFLHDLFTQAGVSSTILSAFSCPSLAQTVSHNEIDQAFNQKKVIIFVGGTGNPFFTTDTAAVLRALEIGAKEVWKATKVDGVYNADPMTNPDAKLLPTVSYQDALDMGLAIMDRTAITLAQQHSLPIRVFSMQKPNALQETLENPDFGSTIR